LRATTLTFTTANWNTAQTVAATAVNDAIVEGGHTCSTGAISASGGDYAGITGTAPSFTVNDNDTGTIVVTTTTATATEGGATGAFTVALGFQPSATVTVTVAVDPTGQCTFAPTTLTFTTANWATAQTVTTTAVNDLIVEGAHSCNTGAISASGGGYTGITGTAPTFTITDNDTGTIVVTTTTATATEGGATGAFTVALGLQPSASVTVTVAVDPTGQCTFAPITLTFTTANWATAQTVTTTAVNDLIVEGAHACTTGTISASGGGYTGITGTAPTFAITDNDTGTIVVTTTTATATEGGATGAFTVVLGLQPSATVTVTVAVDAAGQCTFAPTTLTFTTANWATAQTVTTTAVNDLIVEGAHSCTTGAISASGGGYTGITGTAPTFTINDNDTGTIVVTTTTATATEGGATGAFTVVLGLQPSATVTVTVAVDPTGQCTFAPTTLTFTTANWATAQTVTTTAVNDLIVESAHSCTAGAISASGGGYTGITGTAPTFTITDNDTGTIVVTTTTATATEGGATGAFTVALGFQPSATVTVTVAVDPTGQCTFAPTTLTFTTANWATAQTVTTTAVNDLIVEGAHACTTGTISASGGGYTGITGTAPTFAITDNDTGTIVVTTTTATATEGGATGAFTVVLGLQPSATVTVTVAVDAAGQCTFAPTTLTFTTANWATAQTVTTTAVNDLIVEGAHSCTTGAISASGGGYTGITGTAPTFTINDNDTGTIVVTTTTATATEGGATGAFTVALGLQPSASVTVTVAVDAAGQCTFAPTTLTFTTANWATAQTVTTTAVNDLIVEGAHSCTTGAISASSGGYTGITGTAPTFTITDNDTASITLAKNASVASVGNAGSVINYTIQITNTGNVAATAITVTDSLVPVVCPTSGTNTISTLAPSTSETCTASYTATQTDFDTNGGGDGDIDNSASASGTSGGVPVSASGSEAVLCTQNPALTLVKSANQAGPLTAGQTIVYSFVATNTGNVTLSDCVD
jgi:predicted Fe-Mo cluster-binding NifX family protein